LPVALPRAVGIWTRLRDWLRHRGWRLDRWLSASRALSAEHGTLNDVIFASVLFGWRPRLLDFVLPRRLLRPYLGGTLRRALLVRAMFAAALAAVSTRLVGYAWQQWIREATESRLLAMQNTAHAEYKVTIRHRKETAALAQALSATLAADGFDTTIIEAALEPPREDAQSLPLVNQIQWGDSADEPTATSIAQRLAYLTWGQAPEVTELTQSPGLKELRVLLRTLGTTGSEFTDSLVNPLTPEQITELVTLPESLPEAQQPQEPQEPDARETGQVSESLSRTFRDPLQIGGDGPEMVSLPGGTFSDGLTERRTGTR